MPETKPAWESLEKLQAFPTFQNQDAASLAQAPGARNYLPTQDERNWYDPNPGEAGPFRVQFEVGGAPWVMYRFAFTGKMDAAENGIVSSIAMPITQAARVNIKPSGAGMTNVPGTGKVVPVPLNRDLLPTERIRRQTPFSPFEIRNLDVSPPSEQAAADAQQTAAATVRIEAKVDKILAKLQIT